MKGRLGTRLILSLPWSIIGVWYLDSCHKTRRRCNEALTRGLVHLVVRQDARLDVIIYKRPVCPASSPLFGTLYGLKSARVLIWIFNRRLARGLSAALWLVVFYVDLPWHRSLDGWQCLPLCSLRFFTARHESEWSLYRIYIGAQALSLNGAFSTHSVGVLRFITYQSRSG
jgi:hypothetical protein